MDKHNCPICKKELKFIKRYPNYVCNECSSKATSKTGRKLIFSNINFSGGFEAFYADTKEIYSNHICFIDGVECFADEARFGGIVIELNRQRKI
jgi:DNA-directed RNA polymerase subunit RPC12/RpoP